MVYSQQNHSQTYAFFQIGDLDCDPGPEWYYEDPMDHTNRGWQIGASVSLLLALSMLDL